MEKFIPNINRRIFKKCILEIQQNEGNNAEVIKIIESKLKDEIESAFYNLFLKICSDYGIGFYSFKDTGNPENEYVVIVTCDGYDSYEMRYKEIGKEIGQELAETMYTSVAVKIKNEIYFRELNINLKSQI